MDTSLLEELKRECLYLCESLLDSLTTLASMYDSMLSLLLESEEDNDV